MENIIIVTGEVGVIAKVARTLDEAGVNIESLNTEKTGKQSTIALTTDNADLALRALTEAGFRTATYDSLDKGKTQMKVVELPATPEVLARVDLSHNGTDMLCAKGDLVGPRCQKPPVSVFLYEGFLWAVCEEHKDKMRWGLSIMSNELPAH